MRHDGVAQGVLLFVPRLLEQGAGFFRVIGELLSKSICPRLPGGTKLHSGCAWPRRAILVMAGRSMPYPSTACRTRTSLKTGFF